MSTTTIGMGIFFSQNWTNKVTLLGATRPFLYVIQTNGEPQILYTETISSRLILTQKTIVLSMWKASQELLVKHLQLAHYTGVDTPFRLPLKSTSTYTQTWLSSNMVPYIFLISQQLTFPWVSWPTLVTRVTSEMAQTLPPCLPMNNLTDFIFFHSGVTITERGRFRERIYGEIFDKAEFFSFCHLEEAGI